MRAVALSMLLLPSCALGEPVEAPEAPAAVASPAVVASETVAQGFPPPEGAVRAASEGFGAWLGGLQLAPVDQPVHDVNGRVVGHRARVIVMPLVKGDLQQCADSLMRLRATWQREQGVWPSFHATSGDAIGLQRVAGGEWPSEKGGKLVWAAGGPAVGLAAPSRPQDVSEAVWDGWLARLFLWAGTRSLAAYDTVAVTEMPEAGELLVVGGSPGHTVILLDVAQRGAETFVLVGEGYMPAQDFHVELGPEAGWWRWEPGLHLDHWALPAESLRRFK